MKGLRTFVFALISIGLVSLGVWMLVSKKQTKRLDNKSNKENDQKEPLYTSNEEEQDEKHIAPDGGHQERQSVKVKTRHLPYKFKKNASIKRFYIDNILKKEAIQHREGDRPHYIEVGCGEIKKGRCRIREPSRARSA